MPSLVVTSLLFFFPSFSPDRQDHGCHRDANHGNQRGHQNKETPSEPMRFVEAERNSDRRCNQKERFGDFHCVQWGVVHRWAE
jgi:hypothetical protein